MQHAGPGEKGRGTFNCSTIKVSNFKSKLIMPPIRKVMSAELFQWPGREMQVGTQ